MSFETKLPGLDGFVVYGGPATDKDIMISYDQANELKEFVVSDYFEKVPSRAPYGQEYDNRQLASKGYDIVPPRFGSSVPIEEVRAAARTPRNGVGVTLLDIDDDTWKLSIGLSNTRHLEIDSIPQRTESYYSFLSSGEMLLEATMKVRVIRNIARYSMGDHPSLVSWRNSEKRKMERQIIPSDLQRIQDRLQLSIEKAQEQLKS